MTYQHIIVRCLERECECSTTGVVPDYQQQTGGPAPGGGLHLILQRDLAQTHGAHRQHGRR